MRLAFAALLLVLFGSVACDGADGDAEPEASPTSSAPTGVPGASDRATLTGTLTLDGAPLVSQFVGVRVVRDGLVTACQTSIPPAIGGPYEIGVAADAEVRGCGAVGADLLLWTYVDGTYLFSEQTVPWPGDGASVTFDATFARNGPLGAGKRVTELKGHLFGADGELLPGGSVVEAYAGETRCGVTSRPYGNATEGFFTLLVAGPDSVPGCDEGVTLAFRIDGEPAREMLVNDLAGGASGHELDLTLR